MKTIDFLDALKARHGLPSDYAAAKILGITTAQSSRYRTGKDFLGDAVAMKVAALLDLPPGYVLACVHAERAQDEAIASAWHLIAKTMKKAGAATATGLLLCLSLTLAPRDATASCERALTGKAAPGLSLRESVYYVNSLVRRLRSILADKWPLLARLFGEPSRVLTFYACQA